MPTYRQKQRNKNALREASVVPPAIFHQDQASRRAGSAPPRTDLQEASFGRCLNDRRWWKRSRVKSTNEDNRAREEVLEDKFAEVALVSAYTARPERTRQAEPIKNQKRIGVRARR